MFTSHTLERAHYQHAVHYLNKMKEVSELYLRGGTQSVKALRIFSQYWPQIKHSYQWVITTTEASPKVLRLRSGYALISSDILSSIQSIPEMIDWLKNGLEAAETLGDQEKVAHHLVRLGRAYIFVGETIESQALYERALVLAQNTGNKKLQAESLVGLGKLLTLTPTEWEQARTHLLHAVAIFRQLGDQQGLGWGLQNLSSLSVHVDDLTQARRYGEEAVEIFRQLGHPWHIASALRRLGSIIEMEGDYPTALFTVTEALDLARSINALQLMASCLSTLGLIFDLMGQTERAYTHFVEAMRISQQIGDKRSEALCVLNIAWIEWHRGELSKAEARFKHIIEAYTRMGDRRRVALCFTHLAFIQFDADNPNEMRRYLTEALHIFDEIHSSTSVLYTIAGFVLLMMQQQDWKQAAILLGAVHHHPNMNTILDPPIRQHLDDAKDQLMRTDLLNPKHLDTLMQKGAATEVHAIIQQLLQRDR
jgi:tetratricopeptide (TPR) repeat protein